MYLLCVPVRFFLVSFKNCAEDVFVRFQMSVENNNTKLTLESDKFNYVNEEHGFVS